MGSWKGKLENTTPRFSFDIREKKRKKDRFHGFLPNIGFVLILSKEIILFVDKRKKIIIFDSTSIFASVYLMYFSTFKIKLTRVKFLE